MRTLKLALSLTFLLPLSASCTDDPPVGGDSGDGDSTASDTAGDGDGDQETSDTDNETTTGDGDGDGDPGTGDGDGDGDPGTGDGDGDPGTGDGDGDPGTGDGDGDAAGVCAQGCVEDEDCCPNGAFNCPSQNYPDNYSCNDQGVCEFGGCANDDDCGGVLSNDECHPIDGTPTCFEPCVNDADCLLMVGTTCSGESDDGESYCAAPEAPPCASDDDCGGNGLCDVESGACYCSADSNCTSNGLDTCSFG